MLSQFEVFVDMHIVYHGHNTWCRIVVLMWCDWSCAGTKTAQVALVCQTQVGGRHTIHRQTYVMQHTHMHSTDVFMMCTVQVIHYILCIWCTACM